MKENVPDLPSRSASVLLEGTDEELREYYVEKGHDRIRLDFHHLSIALQVASSHQQEFLIDLMERVGIVRKEEFRTAGSLWLGRYLKSLPNPVRNQVFGVVSDFIELRDNNDIPDEERNLRLEEMLKISRKTGHIPLQAVIISWMAQLQANRGNDAVAHDLFFEALRLSESIDYTGMACQNLGTLSSLSRRMGNSDEADALLDKMAKLARKTRFALHAARAESFRGHVALNEGRFNAAYLYFMEARDVFIRYKGTGAEINQIRNIIKFFKELECWNIVADFLRQAEGISFDLMEEEEALARDYLRIDKADVMAGQGDIVGALELADEIVGEVHPKPWPQLYAASHIQNARLLLKASLAEEALKTIGVGFEQAQKDHLDGAVRQLRILKVEALEELGRTAEALLELEGVAFDLEEPDGVMFPDARDEALLGIKLARAEYGVGPESAAAFVRAMRILHRRMTTGPPSAHLYLALQGFDDLRWLVHELIADDPILGYEFDMAWRGLTEVAALDVVFAEGAHFPDFREAVRGFVDLRLGEDRNRFWAETKKKHLVFVVTETEIWRWTRMGSSVERQRLKWQPDQMREKAALALRGLSTKPASASTEVEEELQGPLEELCRLLIPTGFMEEGGEVWISADDALAQLPFATFDRDEGAGFSPLLATMDIGYLRYFRTDDQPENEMRGGLVVGDPVIASEWVRRHGGLVPLPHARQEALRAAEAISAGTVLLGEDARKTSILRDWEDAVSIYFAGHVVREKNVPYLTMIPLVGDTRTTRPSDEILEVADILQADFAGCELVVLSGCASGAPYVEGTRTAPGLGDAFLDAGVRHVAQTLWQVEDESTASVLLAVLPAKVKRQRFGAKLTQVQREMAAGNEAVAHPYFWGGFGVAEAVQR